MSTKHIFLIRHGETDYNKRGIVQGSGIDSDLNEIGKKQAEAFFSAYKDVPFDAVYTSTLKRTHQSVKGFLEQELPHIILPGLNEISWGHKEGKAPDPNNDSSYFQLIDQWRRGETHIPATGGESPEQVAGRQKEAIDRILKHEDERLVLVAMHGRAMRILLTWLSGLPFSEMDCFHHQNLCLYKLEYSYLTNKFQILEANNTDHLQVLAV
ncbi:histidine phosphatase family protein [Jiulongibacter sediminis]|jgi:probable phosphoglycerate mutase|uniref:histidine phosphatase family protein n=1 Tax=Jiulongibacter sediminis TaxID=1605367 RepID=UPI0026F0D154|nr:histidine phosphatase family protein [Jiulongibacter sediminis]